MEGTIIWRQIQKFNQKLWWHNVVGIVLLLGLCCLQYRYLYNCYLGPQKINADQLVKLEDADRIDRDFVTFTSAQVIDTGINQISINRKTQVETIYAKYAIAILDRGKAILIEVQPEDDLKNLTFSGKISEILNQDDVKVFDQVIRDQPELVGKVSPLMLEKVDYTDSADTFLLFLIGGLGICSWNLYKAKVRTNYPRKHPIYRSLSKYGDGDLVADQIEHEIRAYDYNQELGGRTFFLTPSWLLITQIYNLDIIKLDRLIWVFKKVTRHSVNFIPTGKTYALVLHDCLGKERTFSMSEGEADRVINQINMYAPWIVLGFSSETKKMWDKQRQSFYAMVERRRNKSPQSSSETSRTPSKQENQVSAQVTSPKPENKPQEQVKSPNRESKVEEKATSPNQINPETRNRAIALANYDKTRIERLLNFVRRNHPNQSEQWYWEKILYDMERDRGF